MGSGTTGVACLRNQRQFVGVDSDKESFVLARRRLQHEQNEREDLLGRLGV